MASDGDKRVLFIQSGKMGVGVSPNGHVALMLGKPHRDLGFDPELEFAAELTPREARWLADLLLRKALEAEGGPTPH